jgi:hypothetical protein
MIFTKREFFTLFEMVEMCSVILISVLLPQNSTEESGKVYPPRGTVLKIACP